MIFTSVFPIISAILTIPFTIDTTAPPITDATSASIFPKSLNADAQVSVHMQVVLRACT